MTRTAEQIREEWIHGLFPPGNIERQVDSNLSKLLLPFSGQFSQLEQDIASLVTEISPETAVGLLTDYADVLGPDPFGRDQGSLTIEQLRALLFSRWTARGGQSISYYTQLAESLGLSIEIYEPDPPVYGTFCWGDGTVFGTPENDLWVWQVTLPQPGTGLEAVFLANCQPDVEVVFRYASGSGFGNYAFNQLPFGN